MECSDELILINKGNGLQYYQDIINIREDENAFFITYKKNSIIEYPISKKQVKKLKLIRKLDITNKAFYIRNIMQQNPKEVYEYDQYYKLILQNNSIKVVESKYLTIKEVENVVLSGEVINYFRELSKVKEITKNNEEEFYSSNKSYLEHQYDILKIIRKDSVLNSYIAKEKIKYKEDIDFGLIYPFKFNQSQLLATRNAFKSDVSVIAGPPGTGKTQTILNIIANIIMQNKTVAIVSSNNSAISNIYEKLEKYNFDFLIANLGNGNKRKNFINNQPFYPNMVGWYMENYSSQVNHLIQLEKKIEKIMLYQNKLKKIEYLKEKYIIEKKYFDRLFKDSNSSYDKKISFYKLTTDRIIDILAHLQIEGQDNNKNQIITRLKWLIKFGVTDFSELIKENKAEFLLYEKYYNEKILEIENKITEYNKHLIINNYDALVKEYDVLALKVFKGYLYKRYHKNNRHVFEEETYLKIHYERFVQEYPITISTTHAIRDSMKNNTLFDYVIIDEASQVDLLTGNLAMSAARNLIVVGDDKQLPHIVTNDFSKNNNEIFPRYKLENYYNYADNSILTSLINMHNLKNNHNSYTLLKEHYRCHPKIIGFCNNKYYNNELIIYSKVNSNTPLSIYRSALGNHMRHITVKGDAGKYNQREIDMICNEILDVGGVVGNEDKGEIGIISPYRKQIDKLSKEEQIVEKDTVHKFQGREKNKIIFSTVIDKTRKGQEGIRFVADPNLLNVAVSRAVEEFVLVTDKKAITKTNNDIADLIQYIEYYAEDSSVIDSEIISIFDLLYSEYSPRLEKLRQKALKENDLKYMSEKIVSVVLQEVLNKNELKRYKYKYGYKLHTLFKVTDNLDNQELKYLLNKNTEVDFLIYNTSGNKPILGIEVNGVEYHENKIEQIRRDELKKSIFKKYNLPLLVLETNKVSNNEQLEEYITNCINNFFDNYFINEVDVTFAH